MAGRRLVLRDLSPVSDHAGGSPCLQQGEELLAVNGYWRQTTSKPPRGAGEKASMKVGPGGNINPEERHYFVL